MAPTSDGLIAPKPRPFDPSTSRGDHVYTAWATWPDDSLKLLTMRYLTHRYSLVNAPGPANAPAPGDPPRPCNGPCPASRGHAGEPAICRPGSGSPRSRRFRASRWLPTPPRNGP